VPLLGMNPVTGLDDEVIPAWLHSPVHGSRPELRPQHRVTRKLPRSRTAFSPAERRNRTTCNRHCGAVSAASQASPREALKAQRLPTLATRRPHTSNAIRVGAMHGMKGLEFQAVAVIAVENGTVPAPAALTPLRKTPLCATKISPGNAPRYSSPARARETICTSPTPADQPIPAGETSASI